MYILPVFAPYEDPTNFLIVLDFLSRDLLMVSLETMRTTMDLNNLLDFHAEFILRQLTPATSKFKIEKKNREKNDNNK